MGDPRLHAVRQFFASLLQCYAHTSDKVSVIQSLSIHLLATAALGCPAQHLDRALSETRRRVCAPPVRVHKEFVDPLALPVQSPLDLLKVLAPLLACFVAICTYIWSLSFPHNCTRKIGNRLPLRLIRRSASSCRLQELKSAHKRWLCSVIQVQYAKRRCYVAPVAGRISLRPRGRCVGLDRGRSMWALARPVMSRAPKIVFSVRRSCHLCSCHRLKLRVARCVQDCTHSSPISVLSDGSQGASGWGTDAVNRSFRGQDGLQVAVRHEGSKR